MGAPDRSRVAADALAGRPFGQQTFENYKRLRDGSRTVDLQGCARCAGEGHKDLTFTPLTHPHVPSDAEPGLVFTHWAPCPTNGEPIMMRITEDKPAEFDVVVPLDLP